MKKTKILFISMLGLASLATVTATAAVVSNKGFSKFSGVGNTVTWNHYPAVAPSFDSNGIKEYWVSCDSHVHQFEAPTGDNVNIIDQSAPTQEFISSLPANDDRLVVAYQRAISFEDGVIPNVLKVTGGNTFSVTEEDASDGTHSLKIVMTGSGNKVGLEKAYVEALFAHAGNPEAILFDVKATTNIGQTVGLPDFYYESKTKNYKTGKYDSYTGGASQRATGIATYWKTFAITKTIFEDMTDNCIFLWVDNQSGQTLYVDNIRMGDDFDTSKLISFESSSIHKDGAFIGADNRNAGWGEQFRVTSENLDATTVEFSDEYVSHGATSLHVQTSAATKISFHINAAMYNASDVKGIAFDIYTPADAEISNVMEPWNSRGDNTGHFFSPINYTQQGKWITFIAEKEGVNSGNNMLFRFDNEIVTNIYIDNVRLVTNEIDFEDGEVSTFNNTYYGYSAKYSNSYLDNMQSKNGTDFYAQGNFNVSVSSEKSNGKSRSLKVVATAPYSGIYISERLYNALPDSGLKFDLYLVDATNLNFLNGGSIPAYETLNDWQTITVPKDKMVALNGGYILFTYSYGGTGTVVSYIDNVRPGPATVEETLNSNILNQDADDIWY